MVLRLGIYRHYKGNEYEVMGVGKHTETLEDLVLYKSLDDSKLWARPMKMFNEYVPGTSKLRFEFIREK